MLAAVDDERLLVRARRRRGRRRSPRARRPAGCTRGATAPTAAWSRGCSTQTLTGPPGNVLGGADAQDRLLRVAASSLFWRSVSARRERPVTFADPAGDAGNAPDLTSVVVDNDAGGKVSMVISWANAAYLNEDSFISVYFNSDRNAATGNAALGLPAANPWQRLHLRLPALERLGLGRSSIADNGDRRPERPADLRGRHEPARSRRHNGVRLLSGQRAARGKVVLARDNAPDSRVWTYRLAGFAPAPTTPSTPKPAPNRCRRCRRRSGSGQ